MSIAKNTKETFLEEIADNLNNNERELPVDCKPRNREEILLAEIEKYTRLLLTKLDELTTTLNDHLENHPSGGNVDNDIDTSLENYLHKIEDKALLSDLTNGDIDDKYVTPVKLAEYLSDLFNIEIPNINSINAKQVKEKK